jgi:hypothetical protein
MSSETVIELLGLHCSRGTEGSNPAPSSEESNANLMPTTSSQPPVRHDIRGPRILAA